jgi:hypothetical protein
MTVTIHPLEILGLAGMAVSLAVWFVDGVAGGIVAAIACVPLFTGQRIRHRKEDAALAKSKGKKR